MLHTPRYGPRGAQFIEFSSEFYDALRELGDKAPQYMVGLDRRDEHSQEQIGVGWLPMAEEPPPPKGQSN